MRRSRRFLAIAVGLLLTAPASAQEQRPLEVLKGVRVAELQKVGSTIFEVRQVETSQNPSVRIDSLKVAPNRVSFRLVMPAKAEAGGSSLSRFRYDEKALAAFPGGFLDTFSPPTAAGLVQHRDRIRDDIRDDPVMTAVVCYSNDPIRPVVMMATQEFVPGKTKGDCVQAGPFLVKNGKAETDFDALEKSLNYYPFARGQFQRGFLLSNTRNEIVIGVSTPMSLFALRELLLKSTQGDGFEAALAVALSGGRTAGLVVESSGKKITAGAVQTPLPNAVVIRER